MKVPRVAWGIWAVLFVVLEGLALFNDTPNDTLTQTLAHTVPGWLIAMGLGWLTYHFYQTYIAPKDGR